MNGIDRGLGAKVLSLLPLLLLAWAQDADAGYTSCGPGCLQADTCSQSDVQSAIEAASDGNTVKIPEGPPCSWATTVTISKGITLQGTGTDKTIIQDGTGSGYLLCPLLVEGKEGVPFRVTGITFRGPVNDPYGFIYIKGTSQGFRIDHCSFEEATKRSIFVNGEASGVIDHCAFKESANEQCQAITICNDEGDDESWARPLDIGTSNAIYVEDCHFDFAYDNDGACDGRSGARIVFRYNRLDNTNVGTHGRDSGGYRSTLLVEIYRNRFSFTNFDGGYNALVSYRGGTGVVFENDFTIDRSSVIKYSNYCSCYDHTEGYCQFDQCLAYPCIDQVGRGPNQSLEPIYEWNDDLNGVRGSLGVAVGICAAAEEHIKRERDFFGDTPRPRYVPFTYPHPSTLGDYSGQRALELSTQTDSAQVNLLWKSVEGAATYKILRNWIEVADVTEPSYSDPHTNADVTYLVTAYDAGGEILSSEGVVVANSKGSKSGCSYGAIGGFSSVVLLLAPFLLLGRWRRAHI